MKWTKNKPTKKGYYWVRSKTLISGKIKDFIVHVYSSTPKGTPDTVFWDGENFSLDDETFLKWSDEPVEKPIG